MLNILAQYHINAYRELYKSINHLSDNEYYKERNLFFKSIHGTLNHLNLADSLWFNRFNNLDNSHIVKLDQELFFKREDLEYNIMKQAQQWLNFINNLNYNELPEFLNYTNISGQKVKIEYSKALIHVFNHGTHHRGQISTIFEKNSTPVIDLFYL